MTPATDTAHGLAPDASVLLIVRILLLIQGAIGVASLLEVLVVSVLQGGVLAPIVAMNFASAAATLWLAARVRTRSRKVRRAVVAFQFLWLSTAAVDVTLSLVMTQRLLEPVPILTRIVLPIAIVRMLRSDLARELFKVRASRKTRRRQTLAEVTP